MRNSGYGRLTIKIYTDFPLLGGLTPLTPAFFKDQLDRVWFYLQFLAFTRGLRMYPSRYITRRNYYKCLEKNETGKGIGYVRERSKSEISGGCGGENGESLFHGYSELSLHLCFFICKMVDVGSVIPGVPS